MKLKFASIYPLTEIEKIETYTGDFFGTLYDCEIKLKIAREMAKWYAATGPVKSWDRYYPNNAEMEDIAVIIDNLITEYDVIQAIPDKEFRFSLIVDYLMAYKKIMHISTFRELIDHKEESVQRIHELLL